MHELSIAESVLEIVEATARRSGATRVNTVRLEIGALSCVGTDALRFCFDAVTRGSIAEAAELEIETVEGQAWCMPCGQTIAVSALGEMCPQCGSHQLHVTGGSEMRVKEITIV